MAEMEFNEILSLIESFDKSTVSRMRLSKGDFCIELEREFVAPEQQAVYSQTAELSAKDLEVSAKSTDTLEITSPLVGTYYKAPEPSAKPFVTQGQYVKAGDVLCVVEAMKLINEIKSPVDAVVAKIHAENGQLLSYGDVIMELSCV